MRQPQSIGDIIPKVIAKMGLTQKVKEAEIVKDWEEIVGKAVARHCAPVELDGGLLIVNVDSSPWLNELQRYSKDLIIQRLHEKLGPKAIKNIRFRIGEVGIPTGG